MGRTARRSGPTLSRTPRAVDCAVGSQPSRSRDRSSPEGFDARGIAMTAARCAVVIDSSNRIVCWNLAAAELFGTTSEQAAGHDLQQVIDARDVFGNRLCSGHCAVHEMVREGEAPECFELEVRAASGQRLLVAVSIVVVLGPDPARYELVYLMTPRRRRRRADEAIDRLLSERVNAVSSESSEWGRVRLGISPRQRQVLRLIASGRQAREIAEALSISVHTVRSHIRNILDKLDVSNQLEAVAKAVRERLI